MSSKIRRNFSFRHPSARIRADRFDGALLRQIGWRAHSLEKCPYTRPSHPRSKRFWVMGPRGLLPVSTPMGAIRETDMRYIVAIFIPPLAMVGCRKPFQLLINLAFWL